MFNLVGIELICTPAQRFVYRIKILEALNKVFDTKIKPPICWNTVIMVMRHSNLNT